MQSMTAGCTSNNVVIFQPGSFPTSRQTPLYVHACATAHAGVVRVEDCCNGAYGLTRPTVDKCTSSTTLRRAGTKWSRTSESQLQHVRKVTSVQRACCFVQDVVRRRNECVRRHGIRKFVFGKAHACLAVKLVVRVACNSMQRTRCCKRERLCEDDSGLHDACDCSSCLCKHRGGHAHLVDFQPATRWHRAAWATLIPLDHRDRPCNTAAKHEVALVSGGGLRRAYYERGPGWLGRQQRCAPEICVASSRL